MKGIELPINVLIFVAIGVIVLIGLVVLLGTGVGGISPILVEAEKTSACGVLVNTYKCSQSTSSITLDNPKKIGLPEGASLSDLCKKYKSCGSAASQEDCCKVNVCGCPGTAVTTGATTTT